MDIEKHLLLNRYLLSLFGVSSFRSLQDKLGGAPIGVDSEGRSHFINILRSAFNCPDIPETKLLEYDKIIQFYVKKTSYKRELLELKYFQYLGILFTEIILDRLKNNKAELLADLNKFADQYNRENDISTFREFGDADLKKFAFWMATGSGKTLVMHINYYQFFNYGLFQPDNIILITPNEGLSKQHFEELVKSGIPCRLYEGGLSIHGTLRGDREVLIIEMTKFVEEKKGGGVTQSVDFFEGKNLIFVDEGHKGKKTEEQKWAKLRNRLAENGFVLEYSATFGQILSNKMPQILEEYAKAIIFDYSYKYFYLDGYGKDFSVLNIGNSEIGENDFQETMFVASLLSFYEQLLVFEKHNHIARQHNLEKPLWIFVGTTVTGKEAQVEKTDILLIVEFLAKVMNERSWLEGKIRKIIDANTGIVDEKGKDVFDGSFEYLKGSEFELDDLFEKVFLGKGKFGVLELKNADGEFGLKTGENNYFGVINIGDASKFKKLLNDQGISVEQEAFSDSLFEDIKKENSHINLLIGSKKFIEGWDTWRVSSMGLLNIGTGQGPQIIQLFGRGVRLKGQGMSLKRSDGKNEIRFLETLNIVGIKADYLRTFLNIISKEDVDFEIIEIPIKPQHEDKWNSLYTLKRDSRKRFENVEIVQLEYDEELIVEVDILPTVAKYFSKGRGPEGVKIEQLAGGMKPIPFPADILDLINWHKIWEEVTRFKITKGYWNLVLQEGVLRQILSSRNTKVIALPEIFDLKNFADLEEIEDIAILLIKKYIDMFYKRNSRRFETKNLEVSTVGEQPPLFVFEKPDKRLTYTLQIDKKEKHLIKRIREFAENIDTLLDEENGVLPRIYFDKHLYVPVLLQNDKIDKITPAGLVDSETEFIKYLRIFWEGNRKKFPGINIYLLRNIPKSGVGFFNLSGFYPDFIMWIKEDGKQRMVFIDPKGMIYGRELNNEKIQLKNKIKELEVHLGREDLILESFIISKTKYSDLIRGMTDPPACEDYKSNHVLFLEDRDWPEQLFGILNI